MKVICILQYYPPSALPVPVACRATNTGLMDQEALMVSAVAACYKALVAKLGAKLEPEQSPG